MLVSAKISRTPTVEHLIKIWALRYMPNMSSLTEQSNSSSIQEVQALATAEGRAATITKFKKSFVDLTCEMASVQSSGLYQQSSNLVNFNEARLLNGYTAGVYHQLLELYFEHGADQSELLHSDPWKSQRSINWISNLIPNVQRVAEILEPTLMLFQSHYASSKDWRTLGTLTTQLNFTSTLLLPKLTPIEQALITPFFRFIEEQVALPWQRVCAAAARHDLDSAEFILVEQLLPDASEIAKVVYQQIIREFPHHCSRRGKLVHPGVTHSCLRDLNMLQAYLWLCLFQGHLEAIAEELAPLCIMVLPRVGVQWDLIDRFNTKLSEEVLRRLNSQQKSLLKPYTDGLISAFRQRQADFETPPDHIDISKLKDLIQIKTKLAQESYRAILE